MCATALIAYTKLGVCFSSGAGASVSGLAGKWKPSQTDVNGMVNSTIAGTGGTPCILCDMGAFHLAEFARTLCRPFVGSAVHGGIHILQIGSMKLHPRMLTFPTLNSTFKVWHLGKLNTMHFAKRIMAPSYICI